MGDCTCVAGYTAEADGVACTACEAGTYKPGTGSALACTGTSVVVASGRIKCFEVGEQLLSLADAQAECERRGGNLASILSDAENQAAVALGSGGWLGASDGVSEGT